MSSALLKEKRPMPGRKKDVMGATQREARQGASGPFARATQRLAGKEEKGKSSVGQTDAGQLGSRRTFMRWRKVAI